MTIYWILFFTIFAIQLIPMNLKLAKKLKIVLPFLLIFIYASIRVNYGCDYIAYKSIYKAVHNYSSTVQAGLELNLEYGYILLNKITPSYRMLIIILSAFTCYTYYWLFKNFIPKKYYMLGFLLMAIFNNYILFFQLSGLRNAISVNILVLSLPFILKRKIVTFTFLMLLAMFFHLSAVFFFPIAFFVANPSPLSKRDITMWTVLTIVSVLIGTLGLARIIEPLITHYFVKYSPHIVMIQDIVYNRSILMYGFVFLYYLLILVIIKHNNTFEKKDFVILKLSLLFVFSMMLGPINMRMSHYFAPFFLVSAPIILKKENSILGYSYLLLILVFLLYSFFIVFTKNPFFPYAKYYTIFD